VKRGDDWVKPCRVDGSVDFDLRTKHGRLERQCVKCRRRWQAAYRDRHRAKVRKWGREGARRRHGYSPRRELAA